MESKTVLEILIVLFVLVTLIYSIFYVFGSPLREKITNLKCEFLSEKFITLKSCEELDTISKEEQQKIKAANEKNLINALAYQYENCGKDVKYKCKCTLSFSMADSVILIKKADKILVLTSPDNQKEINIKNLLLDDPESIDHKPLDVKKVIIEKSEIDTISYINYKIKISYDNKIKEYKGPTKEYIDAALNSFGILKDEQGNKMIYIPKNLVDILPLPFVKDFEDTTTIQNC